MLVPGPASAWNLQTFMVPYEAARPIWPVLTRGEERYHVFSGSARRVPFLGSDKAEWGREKSLDQDDFITGRNVEI